MSALENEEEKRGIGASDTPAQPELSGKDEIVELLKAIVFAGLIALGVRTFLYEPFNIPSGSMFPTLLVGDYLFVEKYAYGYSQYSFPLGLVRFKGRIMERPVSRGDIAVFRQPKQPHIDYIKRIVGLPGDTIQVTGGQLFINGEVVSKRFIGTENTPEKDKFTIYTKYLETLPDTGVAHHIYELSDEDQFDNTPEYTVPEGYYFAMGDNRDSSLDSRAQSAVGFVPAENLVGRASFLFFSTEGIGDVCARDGIFAAVRETGCMIVEYPKAVRYGRMFSLVRNL